MTPLVDQIAIDEAGALDVTLLDATAAARALGLSRSTFYAALRAGTIPAGMVVGRRRRWPRALLVAWAFSLSTAARAVHAQEARPA